MNPVLAPKTPRLLRLLHQAVRSLGRGVRGTDLVAEGTKDELRGMTVQWINRSLCHLAKRGRIQVIQKVRGNASNLYAPLGLDPAQLRTAAPLTRRDAILQTF